MYTCLIVYHFYCTVHKNQTTCINTCTKVHIHVHSTIPNIMNGLIEHKPKL